MQRSWWCGAVILALSLCSFLPKVSGQQNDEQRSSYAPHRVNGILVPAGASDVFASYPDDVRAILLPEHALLPKDAMLPCDDTKEDDKGTGVDDPIVALEIGRFALRRGEFARGHCWINHSAYLNGNSRAVILLGVIHLMGWLGPKDPALAFKYFDGGGFKQRDPWAIYFMEQAFMTGNGVPKNTAKAAEFDSYLMTHDDGQALFMMIGSDDAAVMRRYQEISALMDPPTKSVTHCYQVGPNSTVPGAPKNQRCEQVDEVDSNALQRQLNQIDGQK